MRVLLSFLHDERGTFAADAAKAVIAIAFLSLIGVHMMGNRIASEEKDRLAGLTHTAARGKAVDPMTTGSIARDADATKIDPCALPPKR
jgi:hypothetical protein